MISIKKGPSLLYQSISILIVGLLAIPLFEWLAIWLDGLVTPFNPWPHWYGWIIYAVLWFYAKLFVGVFWVCHYGMWLMPIFIPANVYSELRKRHNVRAGGFQKFFVFQARKLASAFSYTSLEFGSQELAAFLNAFHLALTSGISKKDLQLWFLKAFRQGSDMADEFMDTHEVEIRYMDFSTLPELWVNGKPCQVK